MGEVIGLSWDDINLEKQYLTVRRSLSRNNARHKLELGPTKRKKVRQDGMYLGREAKKNSARLLDKVAGND